MPGGPFSPGAWKDGGSLILYILFREILIYTVFHLQKHYFFKFDILNQFQANSFLYAIETVRNALVSLAVDFLQYIQYYANAPSHLQIIKFIINKPDVPQSSDARLSWAFVS